MHPFLTPSLKITSGEISAKEQQEKAEAELLNRTDKKQLSPSTHQNNVNRFKSIFQKIRGNLSLNFVHQPIIQPLITPTLRSASGQSKRPRRQLRATDAPKIKHDRMKQFYMVDIGQKNVILSSYKEVRIPLAREEKISLAMRNQTIQRMEIDFTESWQTRGT